MERALTQTEPVGLHPIPPSTPLDALLDQTVPGARHSMSTVWQRLVPLWRHVVFFSALFAVLGAAVAVRVDVQALRKDLDRNMRAQTEAMVIHDRLQLEIDARRRAAAMEAVATQLTLGPEARVVDIRGGRP